MPNRSSETAGKSGGVVAWLARPFSIPRGGLLVAAALLIGLTAVITHRVASSEPSPLTTKLQVQTGVVDELQGLGDDVGQAIGPTSRVVCVAPTGQEVGSGECYAVPEGVMPDPVPQVGQRVRILHGFVPDNLADPEAGRLNTVVSIEVLSD